MIVISDTSPITNLAAINQLDLLHLLYGEIIIPIAVYSELTQSTINKTVSFPMRRRWFSAIQAR